MRIAKNGRILMLSALLALAVFAVSLGTSAIPSRDKADTKDVIASGTLYIGGPTGSRGTLDRIVALSDVLPAALPRKVNITIKNQGSEPVRVNALVVFIAETDIKVPADALKAEVKDDQGRSLYKGSLLALDKKAVPLKSQVQLAPHQAVDLQMSIQCDEKAVRGFKDDPLYFSLVMFADEKTDQAESE